MFCISCENLESDLNCGFKNIYFLAQVISCSYIARHVQNRWSCGVCHGARVDYFVFDLEL